MSNKISGFTVIFEDAVSEDYMEMVTAAIKLYKGVVAVKPGIEGAPTYMGHMQENSRIKFALLDFIGADFDIKKYVAQQDLK